MAEFDCNQLGDSTVMLMYLERDHIFLDPEYQRSGDIWNLEKKQLLIDSLLNGFDIPKFYLHQYDKAQKHGSHKHKYAIIDGKQRLTAIWEFMDGEYPLHEKIEYLRDPKIKLGGLTYTELSQEHTAIHARFTGRPLSVIAIRTSDTELIEDMFSRLNEAVPLNAAEKRNAFGGPIPPAIRKVVQYSFLSEKVAISATRYRHFDLACKFLYLENQDDVADTKKSTLDSFVIEFREKSLNKKALHLQGLVKAVLKTLAPIFKDHDPLLKSPGNVVVYYLMARTLMENGITPANFGMTRSNLLKFEKDVTENRKIAEGDLGAADPTLLEVHRLSQSPNDASALDFRLKVLAKHINPAKGPQLFGK